MLQIILTYGSFIGTAFIIVFQIIKSIINNRKMKKRLDRLETHFSNRFVETLDYDTMCETFLRYLDEKLKNDIVKKEMEK